MAERALYAHGLQRAIGIEKSGDSDYGIQFQQGQSDSWIIQVNLSGFDLLDQRRRKRILIYFQPDGQRRCRRYTGPNAAVLCAFNGRVQLERAAPKVLVAGGIIAENVLALLGK